MAIRVTCPGCGKSINAGDNWAGKQAKCPACGSPIAIPQPGLELEVAAAPPRLERGHAAQAPSVNVHVPKRSSSVGIVSLILGIVGFLLCWIPFIGILTIPLSGLGVLLGAIGLLVAIVRRGSGIGWPLAGVAVSGLALFVGAAQVAAIGAFADAIDDVSKEANRTNQTTVGTRYNGFDDVSGPSVANDAATEDSTSAGTDHPEAVSSEWASAENPVRQGDVQVRVVKAVQELTPLEYLGDETKSSEEQLSIILEIQNQSNSQKLNYRTWQGADFSLGRDFAMLKDNFGNSYKRINFGIGTEIVGNIRSESIYPGKSVTDRLVFEAPIATAAHLDLELPANNFDGDGMLRIRIPREMFVQLNQPPQDYSATRQQEKEAADRFARAKEQAALEEKEREAKAAREAEEARRAEEEAKFRTWKAANSDKTVEAKLISYISGSVILENRNGKRSKVPVDKLSEEDREFVQKWRKEKR